ncbi:MAG: hypothetical protein ACFFFK_12315 [Candidatus Thorarchaeota archaeon]
MQNPQHQIDPVSLNKLINMIYWLKLSLGMFFGFLSYMIMRLSDLTFFLMVPLLMLVAYIITILMVIRYDRKHSLGLTQKRIIKRSMMYTGTYFIAFIALATLSFYWGA